MNVGPIFIAFGLGAGLANLKFSMRTNWLLCAAFVATVYGISYLGWI